MQFGGVDTRTLKGRTGITRAEIASAVKQIVAAVADEHGLVEVRDGLTLHSNLHDNLGMDEVDLIDVLFRAEERFGLVLPDNNIGPSSTVGDIVDLIVARLREQEAPRENAREVGQAESVLIGADEAPSIADFKDIGDMPHLVPKVD
jgi:acyl carrier protein